MAVPYVSWTGHGGISGLPPGIFTGATMHVFGVQTDPAAIQQLVDRMINALGAPNVTYFGIPGMAMITFMDIARCTSGAEIIGWVPGRECAIWIPLFEDHGLDVLDNRIVLWSPYILISYDIGMVTGREVWGWPKALGHIDMPSAGTRKPALFKCSTTIFARFARTTEGRHEHTILAPDVVGRPAPRRGGDWPPPDCRRAEPARPRPALPGNRGQTVPRLREPYPGVPAGHRQLTGAVQEFHRRRFPCW
jgi:hypothetical protein